MTIISIEDGRIRVRTGGKHSKTFSYCANKNGVDQMVERLANEGITEWCYSSSVDFPDEYGAPDLDFRELIMDAARKYYTIQEN